jgi:hypothetical protein
MAAAEQVHAPAAAAVHRVWEVSEAVVVAAEAVAVAAAVVVVAVEGGNES